MGVLPYCSWRLHAGARKALEIALDLLDSISVGVDRMQRNFGPMQKQVEAWRETEPSNVAANIIVPEAFIEDEMDAPNHLARLVHKLVQVARTQT